MAQITAQDVKRLRDATGAGMMDAKRALTENDGDFDAAARWLREKGLGKAAERTERANVQGAVAVGRAEQAAAAVLLKCETDFVAMGADFGALVQELADLVAAKGEQAATDLQDRVDDLRITLKENIEVGDVVRFEGTGDGVVGAYLHRPSGRGVLAVLVELGGGTEELARDVAMHVAFAKPRYTTRDEVPAEAVDAERATLEAITRNEGKPEAAVPKIVEGRLGGWFKEQVLVDQPFVRDDKRSVGDVLGDATVRRFALIGIGQ